MARLTIRVTPRGGRDAVEGWSADEAGRPILESISRLMGYVSFFENFVQIVVLLFAWIVVLLTFFILAIQLFITLIEFKLTTLAGFVLEQLGHIPAMGESFTAHETVFEVVDMDGRRIDRVLVVPPSEEEEGA